MWNIKDSQYGSRDYRHSYPVRRILFLQRDLANALTADVAMVAMVITFLLLASGSAANVLMEKPFADVS